MAHRKSGVHEVLGLVACRDRRADQGRTASGGPAESEFLYCGVLYAPGAEIGVAHVMPLSRRQLRMEELLGIFRNQEQAFLLLPALKLFGAFLLLDYLYVVLPCEIAQRLHIGAVLLLHHEADRSPGLAAAEALVYALGRRDIERRGLLIVERAAGHIIGPAPPERHVIADNIHYLGRVENETDGFLGYHDAISQRNLIRTSRTSFS